MYQVGEYIVKAFDGVCKVEDILHPQMSGIEKDRMYYPSSTACSARCSLLWR